MGLRASLLAAAVLVADIGSPEEPRSFRDTEFGIEIATPSDWTLLDEFTGAVWFAEAPLDDRSDRFLENCNLVVLSRESRFDDPIRWLNDARGIMDKNMTDFADGERTIGTMAGFDSVAFTYTSRRGRLLLKSRMYVAYSKDRLLIVTCNAEQARFAEYEEMFEATAASLRVFALDGPIPVKTPPPSPPIPGVWDL